MGPVSPRPPAARMARVRQSCIVQEAQRGTSESPEPLSFHVMSSVKSHHGSVPGIRQDWQAWLQSAAAKDLEVFTPTAAPREHTVDHASC